MTQAGLAEGKAASGLVYFPAVDGLRALAVLTVMAFHLNETLLPGGYVGVDIFFVISGFVVTASIAHLNFKSLPDLLTYFYVRRVTRIIPALLVCLLATSLAYCLFIPTAWLSSAVEKTGKWAIFGASNIALAGSDNYFSPRASLNPFTHTWSLGVEEQFYLLFPFLMFFGHGKSGGRTRWLVPAILTLCVCSLVTSAVLTSRHWEDAFYLLPSRYWELGLGMALCLTIERWRPALQKSARLPALLSLTGAGAILCAVAIPTSVTFPFPWALLPAFGSVALIAVAVSQPQGLLISALRWTPVVFVGQISYALYLWHWPIDVLMRWTFGLDTWLTGAAATLAAFALAIFSFYFVETPIRRWGHEGRAPRYLIVGAGVGAACALAVLTTAMFHNKDLISLSRTRDVAAWYPTTIAPSVAGCAVASEIGHDGAAIVKTFVPKNCASPHTPGRLAVGGDSHADGYTRMFADYARASGREVIVYSIAGCAFVGLTPEKIDTACARDQIAVAQKLGASMKAGDVIFLPSLRMPRYAIRSEAERALATAPREDGAPAGWTSNGNPAPLLAAMMANGAQIVFEGPKPVFKSPTFRCADWFNADNPDCAGGMTVERAELEVHRAPVLAAMRSLAAQDQRISIWDPFPLLCPDVRCDAFQDDKPLFFDGDHLSGYGNDVLRTSFRDAIEAKFALAP